MDETIVHAYGVIAADEPLTQFPLGIADTTVSVYGVDNLAAIVSFLPVEGFGVADWERNATNVGWLERVARQHHEVLQYATMTAAVVPLRLPSVYGSLESLAATVHAASDRLERDLRRIGGKVEWAVKVYRTGEEQGSAVTTASTSGRDYLLGQIAGSQRPKHGARTASRESPRDTRRPRSGECRICAKPAAGCRAVRP